MHLRATLDKADMNEAVEDFLKKRKKRLIGEAHFLIAQADRPGENPTVSVYADYEDEPTVRP